MSEIEQQQAQHAALEKARLQAEREKQENRLRTLAKCGHDITKLKAKFEGQSRHEY